MPKFILPSQAVYTLAKELTHLSHLEGFNAVYGVEAKDKNIAAMQLARELVPFFEENLAEVVGEQLDD